VGRATLGLGAAWFEREHHGLGVAFPPVAERFERLEETLRICAQMWDAENNGPFEGRHYRLAETLCSPQPLHRPAVMIGGGGERKTLRLVARYGDACNLFTTSVEDVAHKLDVLRRHCDDVGRDYDDIRRTRAGKQPAPHTGNPRRLRPCDGRLREARRAHRMVTPLGSAPAAWSDGMAPAAARLAELG
jgi:alkanesulfonate monooxygenase SsuD/methylene tetrahydromethanopterin reductase-like flavin-dependent oxidoreductase (luciferase family)